jgi:flagellar assembly factor FliW
VEGELPDLVFVRPLPGFPELTRFVLVRLGDSGAAGPDSGSAGGGSADGGSADVAGGTDVVGGTDVTEGEVVGGEAVEHGAVEDDPVEHGAVEDDPVEHGAVEDDALMYELRSLERPEVRFLVAVPSPFFPDYTIELDEIACTELDLHDAGDALVLVVLTVDPDSGGATANLLAPVVVNARTRHAAQVILSGSDWPVRAAVA